MATQSPFSWLADSVSTALRDFTPPPPPAWALQELQQRVVLFLNHVLMQEPVARERLQRVQGRTVRLSWRDQQFVCEFTPAGLLDVAAVSDKTPDLVLHVNEDSPLALARTVLQGQKPPVRIEGDVQLAADVNWLIDHVRWEPEEDLARLIGDAPAHTLAEFARRGVTALRSFVQTKAGA
jgi:ubiquinone biosynthesis protein UbiJ